MMKFQTITKNGNLELSGCHVRCGISTSSWPRTITHAGFTNLPGEIHGITAWTTPYVYSFR